MSRLTIVFALLILVASTSVYGQSGRFIGKTTATNGNIGSDDFLMIDGTTNNTRRITFTSVRDYVLYGNSTITLTGAIVSPTGIFGTITGSDLGTGFLYSAEGRITGSANILGTTNQIIVSGTNILTISSPQDTNTGSQVSFGGIGIGNGVGTTSTTQPMIINQAPHSLNSNFYALKVLIGGHTNQGTSYQSGVIFDGSAGITFSTPGNQAGSTTLFKVVKILAPTIVSQTGRIAHPATLYFDIPVAGSGMTFTHVSGLHIPLTSVTTGTGVVIVASAISATAPTGAQTNYVARLCGDILLKGNLNGTGTNWANDYIGTNLTLTGSATTGTLTTSNLLLQGSLTGGLVVANGGTGVSYTLNPTLTGALINGLITITGGLVSNTISNSGIMTVGGVATINNNLTVTGNQTILGTLTVTGQSVFAGATFNGALTSTGSISAVSHIGTIFTSTGGVLTNTLTTTGNLIVGGTITVTGATTWYGAATLNNNLTVTGTTILSGNITGSGNMTLLGALTMSGLTTLSGLQINNNIIVNGSTTLSNNVTMSNSLTVLNNVTLSGVLSGSTATLGTLTLNTGGTSPLRFGRNVSFTTFGAISLNNNFTDTGLIGFFAGGDSNLYFNTTGTIVFRPGGTGVNTQFIIAPGGNLAIGSIPATARLNLAGGTTTTSAINIASGTFKTTPIQGDVEFNGINLTITRTNNFRETIITSTMGVAPTTTGTITAPLIYYGTSGTIFLSEPNAWITVTDASGTARRIPAYNP